MSSNGPSFHEIFPNEVIYMFLSHLSVEQKIGVQRVNLLWRFLSSSLLNDLKDFVKREYSFLTTDALTDSAYVALFKNQKRIYLNILSGICTPMGENAICLPLEVLERKHLEAFAKGEFVPFSFTPAQAIFLKEMIVAIGLREDHSNLNKGEIFKLMAGIGNTRKLKEWGEKNEGLPYGDALRRAAESGNLGCVQYLYEKKEKDSYVYKQIAIEVAAENGQLACMKYLIKKRIPSSQYATLAFEQATKNGHVACVAYLIKKLGKMIKETFKVEAFLWTAKRGHVECMKYLIEQCGEEIACYDKRQKSLGVEINNKVKALIYSVRGGYVECVKYLMERYGKEMDFQDKKYAYEHASGECKEYLWDYLNPVLYGLTYLFDALAGPGQYREDFSLNNRREEIKYPLFDF